METEKATEYKITKHAQTRYAERIMNKDDNNDINRFIIENEEKIKTDITKMITYGEKIYTGKSASKDGKASILDVYLKDHWIVLVDSKSNNVVTIFRIDLGCGDEFNTTYISKMLEKLIKNRQTLENIKMEVGIESSTYRELINDCKNQINEYKSMIKNLEQLCEGYQLIIDNNCVKVSQAEREVAEVVNTLIAKKEF